MIRNSVEISIIKRNKKLKFKIKVKGGKQKNCYNGMLKGVANDGHHQQLQYFYNSEVWTNAFEIRVTSKTTCNKGGAGDNSISRCSLLKFRVCGRCRRSGGFEVGFILAGHKQFLNLFQSLVLRLW